MNDEKNITIVSMYIIDLLPIYCNELRFIIERFLDQNPEYKWKVEQLKEKNYE